jgi:hypothetical protein
VKINGDDMLFKCNRRLYEIFRQTSSEVGFKLSQGKNYLSCDMCLINSQLYFRHNGKMERRGYLNLQLVKGTSSKKGESSATPSDVGASLNKMFHQCPWTLCTIRAALDAAERKLVPTTDRLKFIGRNRSWFVHVDLGGYGIDPCFAPPDWQPTREQRMLAAMMHSMSWLTSYSKSKLSPRMVKFIHKLVPTYLRRYSGPPTSAGDYPGGLSLIELKDNEWFSRLLFMCQAAAPPYEGDTSSIVLKAYAKDHRLHPMSIKKIKAYQPPTHYSSIPPVCPPLSSMRFPQFCPQVYGSLSQITDLGDIDPLHQ